MIEKVRLAILCEPSNMQMIYIKCQTFIFSGIIFWNVGYCTFVWRLRVNCFTHNMKDIRKCTWKQMNRDIEQSEDRKKNNGAFQMKTQIHTIRAERWGHLLLNLTENGYTRTIFYHCVINNDFRFLFPAGTWRLYNVGSTSMQRWGDVVLTSCDAGLLSCTPIYSKR